MRWMMVTKRISVNEGDIPPLSDDTGNKLRQAVESSEGIGNLDEFVKKVYAIVKGESPGVQELSNHFKEGEMMALNSLLVNWVSAELDSNNRWRIKDKEPEDDDGMAEIVGTKTGNVETLHDRGSDTIPTAEVEEIKMSIRNILDIDGGSPTEDEIRDELEREYDTVANSGKIAKAMEEMTEGGEVLIGEDERWTIF